MKIREIILEKKIDGWNDLDDDQKEKWILNNQIFYPGAFPFADIHDSTLRTPTISKGTHRKKFENILDKLLEDNNISVKGITLKSDVAKHFFDRARDERNFVAHPTEDEIIKLCTMAIEKYAERIKTLCNLFYENLTDKDKNRVEKRVSEYIVDDDDYDVKAVEPWTEYEKILGDIPFQFVDITYAPLKLTIAGRIKQIGELTEMKNKKYQGTLLIFRLTSLVRSDESMITTRPQDAPVDISYTITDEEARKQRWADRDRWLEEEEKRKEAEEAARKAAEEAGKKAVFRNTEETLIKDFLEAKETYRSVSKMPVNTPKDQSKKAKGIPKAQKELAKARKELLKHLRALYKKIEETLKKLEGIDDKETEELITQEYDELNKRYDHIVELVSETKKAVEFDKEEQEILGVNS